MKQWRKCRLAGLNPKVYYFSGPLIKGSDIIEFIEVAAMKELESKIKKLTAAIEEAVNRPSREGMKKLRAMIE